MNVYMSIVLGVVLAAVNGELKQIFCKDFLVMQCWFILPAVLFSVGQALSYATQSGEFFDADVGKVLDQTRLLCMAFVSFAFFGKMPSRATWNALCVITLASAVYTMTKKNVTEIEKLKSGKAAAAGGGQNYFAGTMMCLVNCVIMCVASVAAEKFLKQFKKVPFYIQKICIETPQIFWLPIWEMFLSPGLNWCIYNACGSGDRWEEKRAAQLEKMGDKGFLELYILPNFTGFTFSNVWLIVLIISFCSKSYLNGILVKQMSSVVKQICQVTGTSVLYFMLCYFMPQSNKLNLPQIAADLLVFFSVFGYALSNRDKERKKTFKAEIAEQKKLLEKYEDI
jgi:hypothetical protein